MDLDIMDFVYIIICCFLRFRFRLFFIFFLGNFNFVVMKFGEKNEEDLLWELEM